MSDSKKQVSTSASDGNAFKEAARKSQEQPNPFVRRVKSFDDFQPDEEALFATDDELTQAYKHRQELRQQAKLPRDQHEAVRKHPKD